MTDEGVLETDSAFGQGINIRSLHHLVTVATKRAGGLVVSKKEYNIWRRLTPKTERLQNKSDEKKEDRFQGNERLGW